MGDVFDAMNRARMERGDDSDLPSGSAADSGAQAGSTPVQGRDREQPGLPLDKVKQQAEAPVEEDATQSLPATEALLGDGGRAGAPVAPTAGKARSGAGALEVSARERHRDSSGRKQRDSLNGYSERVVVHHDRGSVVTEQYRAIRTQILARARSRRLQIHTITSSIPEEGKTVTTANLGVVFSELRNKKTLMVEGDLRRPTFGKLFERECQVGMLQLLRGEVDDIDQALHETVYDNLQFLPAGGRDATHCTELLSSPRMAQILERLRDRYDHIFVDTPPVISVTDAAILAAMSDQTLLVVRLHKTPVDMVDRAKRLLKANNCNLAGVILTHMKMVFLPGYMSRYSYGYGSAYA